jgi:hypothetical protein
MVLQRSPYDTSLRSTQVALNCAGPVPSARDTLVNSTKSSGHTLVGQDRHHKNKKSLQILITLMNQR